MAIEDAGIRAYVPLTDVEHRTALFGRDTFTYDKEWHGLRRLRLRGLLSANIQGLLIAAGQNLKRWLAKTGWGRRHAPCGSLVALPTEPQWLSAVSG